MGSKSTLLCSWSCVLRPRQYHTVSWEFHLFSGFFFFFLIYYLGTWTQWLWLVSWRRHRVLNQGHTPDLECNLNISVFLKLPHPLHYLICNKNIMIIVLLLQMMERCEDCGVVHLYLGLSGGTEVEFLFSFFLFLFIVLPWLVHDSCVFHCIFSFFFCCLCLWSLQLGITTA